MNVRDWLATGLHGISTSIASAEEGVGMAGSIARRGLTLAAALLLTAALPLLPARATGDTSKPASYAPDETLLEELDGKAAAFKDQVAAPDIDAMVAGIQKMTAAVQQRDLNGTRQAWLDTHAIWMRCEAFTADLFPGLDKKIDGWPDAKTGFHAIERTLFAPSPQIDVLQIQGVLEDLGTYQRVLKQAKFTGYYLIASASTWAFAMGDARTDGGESPVSGNSLTDFQHGLDGIERIWRAVFADAVRARKHFLAEEIDDEIAALRGLLQVTALDQIPEGIFEREATRLASLLADASVVLGWRAPNYTDIGE